MPDQAPQFPDPIQQPEPRQPSEPPPLGGPGPAAAPLEAVNAPKRAETLIVLDKHAGWTWISYDPKDIELPEKFGWKERGAEFAAASGYLVRIPPATRLSRHDPILLVIPPPEGSDKAPTEMKCSIPISVETKGAPMIFAIRTVDGQICPVVKIKNPAAEAEALDAQVRPRA